MNIAVHSVLFFAFISLVIDVNQWRGIVPLQSSCDDVKKLLKVDTCTLPVSNFTTPDFQLSVEFENENCDSEPRAWRVPKGTVIALSLSPRGQMQPSEFGLDLSRYEKRADSEIVGLEHYENVDDGVTVNVYRGFVQTLFLYPRKSDEPLRCQPKSSWKENRVSVLLGDDQSLVQTWLRIQPRTKVPVRLPNYLGDETKPLYAIFETVSDAAYKIQLAFTLDCSHENSCHYGTLSGRSITPGERKPQGKRMSLTNGVTGYFVDAVCGAACPEASLTWDEDGYRYTIALKGQTAEAMSKIAKSSISK